MKMLYEHVVWECCMRMLNENIEWERRLRTYMKYMRAFYWKFSKTSAYFDTPRHRDADASKNDKYIKVKVLKMLCD